MERHSRQQLLPEVGPRGQARISAALYRVSARSVVGQVERAYLQAAGAEDLRPQAEPEAAFAHRAAFSDPAAREFAEGAWRALRQLREALEVDPT